MTQSWKRKKMETEEKLEDKNEDNEEISDPMDWYFNYTIHQPLEKLVEAESAIQQVHITYGHMTCLIIHDSFIMTHQL